jgi:DNA polymerase-1
VVVVTGDKDFLQMVTDDVLVLNPGREGAGAVLYDPKTVEEKFGVRPDRVVDVLALVGDAVDNVPGVPGIGEKGARDLIREFGTLETVLERAGDVKRTAYREGLQKHRDEALLSKKLVTLRTDVPVTLELEQLRRRDPDRAAAFALFTELEFVVLAKEFAPEPAPVRTVHRVVAKADEVRALAEEARAAGRVAVSIVRDERVVMRSRVAGVGLSHAAGQAAYVPVAASPLELPSALPREQVLALLKPLLEDPKVRKVSPRAKYDRLLLAREGVGYEGVEFDVLLAEYMLNPGRRSPNLEDLALEVLGERPAPTPGMSEGTVQTPSLDAVSRAAAQEADLTLRVAEPLGARLREEGLEEAFATLELPLTQVLSEMEQAGVKVDVPLLQAMSIDMERQIDSLTREIHALAGGEFNINSPIQLRDVFSSDYVSKPEKRRPRRGSPPPPRKSSKSWPSSTISPARSWITARSRN